MIGKEIHGYDGRMFKIIKERENGGYIASMYTKIADHNNVITKQYRCDVLLDSDDMKNLENGLPTNKCIRRSGGEL